MNTKLSSPRVLVALCGIVLLALASAAEASHIRGIRVTVTNVDSSDNSVEVDVTAFNDEESPATAGETLGFELLSWGEGETMSSEEINEAGGLAGAGASGNHAMYRGSFSHTYSSPGPFTIRVLSDCCGGEFAEMSAEGGYVGNPVSEQGEPQSPETTEDANQFTNTALVEFGQSVLEIPTASTVGLGLLSLALAGAGLWLVRR